jgi:hypothetical protein
VSTALAVIFVALVAFAEPVPANARVSKTKAPVMDAECSLGFVFMCAPLSSIGLRAPYNLFAPCQ